MKLVDAVRALVEETKPQWGFVGNDDVIGWLVMNSQRVAEVLAQHVPGHLRSLQRGDVVKLKKDQLVMWADVQETTVIPCHAMGVFISDGHNINGRQLAVIELTDHPYREWRIVVELSNLERA